MRGSKQRKFWGVSTARLPKRIREICCVTMCQTFVHRITSEGLQKRIGVFSLDHYLASCTLFWAGDVARIPKNCVPERLMLSWIREPRVAGGKYMTYGWSLQRHLNHFDLPTVLTERAHLAQDRAEWQKLVTTPPSTGFRSLRRLFRFRVVLGSFVDCLRRWPVRGCQRRQRRSYRRKIFNVIHCLA